MLDSLRFKELNNRLSRVRRAHSSTCNWIFDDEMYLQWLESSRIDLHERFLWMKGKAGAGKSTLVKHLLRRAQKKQTGNDIVMSFFFNATGRDPEMSTTGLYRSLSLQLLTAFPSTIDMKWALSASGWNKSQSHFGHEWTIESLEILIEEAASRLGDRNVKLFIDALDECNESEIAAVVSFMVQLCASAGPHIQTCLAIRHYPKIHIPTGLVMNLDKRDGHTKDIAEYIKNELHIGITRSGLKARRDLERKACGVFMWVVLVVRELNEVFKKGKMHLLQKRLEEIPEDLDSLFKELITRNTVEGPEALCTCIGLLLFARRDLSIRELYAAILLVTEPESKNSFWDEFDIPHELMCEFINDASKGLAELGYQEKETPMPPITPMGPIRSWKAGDWISVEERFKRFSDPNFARNPRTGTCWRHVFDDAISPSNGKKEPTYQLIHETVKDFFLRNKLNHLFPEDVVTMNFAEEGNERLKQMCLGLLESPSDPEKEHPMQRYAATHLFDHAEESQLIGIDQSRELERFEKLRLNNQSLIYHLASRDYTELLKIHPSKLSYMEGEEVTRVSKGDTMTFLDTPLVAAAFAGHKTAVAIFLESEIERQPRNGSLKETFDRVLKSQWPKLTDVPLSDDPLRNLILLGNQPLLEFLVQAGKVSISVQELESIGPISHQRATHLKEKCLRVESWDMFQYLTENGARVAEADETLSEEDEPERKRMKI